MLIHKFLQVSAVPRRCKSTQIILFTRKKGTIINLSEDPVQPWALTSSQVTSQDLGNILGLSEGNINLNMKIIFILFYF